MTDLRIGKRWLEILLIVAGILFIIGGTTMAVPQREQLIEISGLINEINYTPGTKKAPPILFFRIENKSYKIEYHSEYIQKNITIGTLVRLNWNPLDSGPVRDVAEIWVGNEQLLTFDLYSKLLGRWKNGLLIIGASFTLVGLFWWRFGKKPLTALE